MNRIYQTKGEIRIEAVDKLYVVAGPAAKRPLVITIEDYFDEDGIDEVTLWVADIDPLINALLDMKRELILEYGEAK